ncbi:MAG: redoxin domain-containing protein [Bacteroidota bacterium]|nr:redoxin domain-containing protein [Bacteroidota bacterium]
MKKLIFTGLLLVAFIHLKAQTNASDQKVEVFTLQNGGGQKISLQDYAANKAVVVVFTNDHCPYSRLYKARLQQLNSDYSGKGVKFLFIQPAISTDNAQSTSPTPTSGNKLSITDNTDLPYFLDTNLKVSQLLGATKTPEAFVLQPQNGSFILRYKGAIDDNPQVESYVKETYLKTAIESVLNNQTPPVTQKRAIGCSIKRF